jgi:predicted LPLAT superfamily acyltransferase
MEKAVYKFTVLISKAIGRWFFSVVARVIATGYFILFPKRVRNSTRFYRALFPGRRLPYYLRCSWMQYQNFTRVFLDRTIFLDSGSLDYTSSGWNHLAEAIQKKEGGIILMSHIGNWEVAAHLLMKRQQQMKLLLFLGSKHKEKIEKLQKDSLQNVGTKVIAVDQTGGSPFLLLESIKWMNEGGLVSLTGDLVWTPKQRVVTVDFLDHQVHLPETPHMLALLSGKPLFIMFSIPNGKGSLQIEVSEPIYVKAENRRDRKNAVQRSAQQYAHQLIETVRRYPFEWFHFESFLK